MANISSWTNKIGDFAHNSLLTGSTYGAINHIGAGAAAGAAYGAGDALYNGGSMTSGAFDGAKKGALLGAGSRYASAKYGEGAFRSTFANHMGYSTAELAKRNKGLSASSHNFSVSNFTQAKNTSYWNADETVGNHVMSESFMSKYRG